MASVTDKLKLTKPELGDTITPEIFSENFQIIDEHVGSLENDMEETKKTLSSTKKTADAAMPKTGGTFVGQTDFNSLPRVSYKGIKRPLVLCQTNTVSIEWIATPIAALRFYVDGTLVATIPRDFNG